MTRMRIGVKPGVGPVVKVMVNDGDDPFTTPNTDHHKFLFNSEVQEIGYAYDLASFSTTGTYLHNNTPIGSEQWHYFPSGSTASNCQMAVMVARQQSLYYGPSIGFQNGREYAVFYAFDRMSALSYRSIQLPLRDNSAWDAVCSCTFLQYGATGDHHYVSKYKFVEDETTENAAGTLYTAFNVNLGRRSPPQGGGTIAYPNFPVSEAASFVLEKTIVSTELPMENDPYPAVTGSFAANKHVMRLGNGVVKLAKPGFDVATATRDQLILSSDKVPMKVAKTGFVTIANGATVSIAVAYPLSTSNYVDYQLQPAGSARLVVPPYPDNTVQPLTVEHRIVGQTLEIRNTSGVAVDVRYFVLTEDAELPSSGGAKILDTSGAYHVIRRPGTAGTRGKDILVDTRSAYMPIVAQGWVPAASVVSAADDARLGSHMYVVNLTNGGFKPFLMARAKYSVNADPTRFRYRNLNIDNIEVSDFLAHKSFLAVVSDTQVKFYVDKGARFEAAYRTGSPPTLTTEPATDTFVGFRYYVFAIPPSL